jgi:hypothetical protein
MILSKPDGEITHPISDLTWLHSRSAAGRCRSRPAGAKPSDEFEADVPPCEELIEAGMPPP